MAKAIHIQSGDPSARMNRETKISTMRVIIRCTVFSETCLIPISGMPSTASISMRERLSSYKSGTSLNEAPRRSQRWTLLIDCSCIFEGKAIITSSTCIELITSPRSSSVPSILKRPKSPGASLISCKNPTM